jgi:hypothetical protein
MSDRNLSAPNELDTIFEFEGRVWFNGDRRPRTDACEFPVVELGWEHAAFCEVWLGRVDTICAGSAGPSRRLMYRFLLGEAIKQAVAEFCESYADWLTDADAATTAELVRRLERWLDEIGRE